jgi:hypothetical protein
MRRLSLALPFIRHLASVRLGRLDRICDIQCAGSHIRSISVDGHPHIACTRRIVQSHGELKSYMICMSIAAVYVRFVSPVGACWSFFDFGSLYDLLDYSPLSSTVSVATSPRPSTVAIRHSMTFLGVQL